MIIAVVRESPFKRRLPPFAIMLLRIIKASGAFLTRFLVFLWRYSLAGFVAASLGSEFELRVFRYVFKPRGSDPLLTSESESSEEGH